MNKVTLLVINAKYVHSSLAVWYLAAGVSRYARLRHEISIVEVAGKQGNENIAEQIIAGAPDVVGIGAYIWNAGKLPELLKLLRERLPHTVFVLGGPEASHNVEYWLTQGADYILRGEGERSFPALLDLLAAHDMDMLHTVNGLCRSHNGKILFNPEPEPEDELINPYSEDYFAALDGRITYIETSRGCPFRCAFCMSGKSSLRMFPLDTAKEQLYKLSKSGTQTIKFVDRTFNCNDERAYELFEYVISLDTACCFHFEVAADLFSDRTLSLLNSAPPGRIQLEAGLQSFYEPTLLAVSRKTDIEKAERNIRTLLSGKNIHVHVDLIAGLPYETLTGFQDGFNRAYALMPHTLQLGFLKLLHGSKLRGQARELEIIYNRQPPYEIISSPWMSTEDLWILKQTENALQHTCNKGRFLSVLQYVLSVSGLQPFSLYRTMGEAAPNHGISLDDYAAQIYNYCAGLPNVDKNKLHDYMICDWLCMVKGKNMPPFLRDWDGKLRKATAEIAGKRLGRVIDCDEAAVLSSGRGVFVDSEDYDPVSGLYRLHFL